MPLQPPRVAPHALLEPLASEVGALIGVGRHTMGFEAHALPQMDRAVGAKLPVFLLDAHMPGRRPPDILLHRVQNALLDISAQGLADVQILSRDLYRHRLRNCARTVFPRPGTPDDDASRGAK